MYVLTYAGSGNEENIISGTFSTSNAITAVVSCAVSFIITTVIGVVVHYAVVGKKSKCQKLYSLIAACKQQKHQAAEASASTSVRGCCWPVSEDWNEGESCIWPCAAMSMDITCQYISQLSQCTCSCEIGSN